MILLTTSDILALIQKSDNTDNEKADFAEKVKRYESTEGVEVEGGLMLVFDNSEHIVLKGLGTNDLLKKCKMAEKTVAYRGIELIKHFEGLYLNAYLDAAKIPTIGRGTIGYPNGKKVKIGDVCTVEQADEYLLFEIREKEKHVNNLTKGIELTQGQFDALVSFVYNLGQGALGRSALLKKIKANPKDATIPIEFLRWDKAAGRILEGLTRRRKSEAHLYMTGRLLFFDKI